MYKKLSQKEIKDFIEENFHKINATIHVVNLKGLMVLQLGKPQLIKDFEKYLFDKKILSQFRTENKAFLLWVELKSEDQKELKDLFIVRGAIVIINKNTILNYLTRVQDTFLKKEK